MSGAYSRRSFIKALTGAALAPALLSACGDEEATSSGPKPIKIGFIPLTDCASLVMAEKLGFFKQYGVNVEVVKEASWANVRDKLLTGDLDAAHCLFSMPFSVYTGVGGKAGSTLQIAMTISNNGQGISLSSDLAAQTGYGHPDKLAGALANLGRTPTFAGTFPGGTHDIWLRYWLAAAGIDQQAAQIITIPPPQMVANMRIGEMDGFCVGEPWNGVAVKEQVGATVLATQDLWLGHPEKALVVNPTFAAQRREELKLVMQGMLEASRWLDKVENRAEAASVISGQAYVNAPSDVIDARLVGQYQLGGTLGERTFDPAQMMVFHRDGLVNAPRQSHAIWFMAQYVRLGLLPSAPDYSRIANELILSDLYAEVAKTMNIALPDDDMQPFTIELDQRAFDPASPSTAL